MVEEGLTPSVPSLENTLRDTCCGIVSTGRQFETTQSRISSLPDGCGAHFILMFKGEPHRKDVTGQERGELTAQAYRIAEELSKHFSPGVWRLEINSEAMGRRAHDHIHIICPNESELTKRGLAWRRPVDDITRPIQPK